MSRLASVKPLNRSDLYTRSELPHSTAFTRVGMMIGGLRVVSRVRRMRADGLRAGERRRILDTTTCMVLTVRRPKAILTSS
jgi:hypothetical protein